MTTVAHRVLIIDDNPAIHEDFHKIIQGMQRKVLASDSLSAKLLGEGTSEPEAPRIDVEVDTASDGEEGVAMLRKAIEEDRPYAVAIVDMRMPPGLNGIETLREMWKFDEHIQSVICTAYSDHTWEDYQRELGERSTLLILKKPVEPVVLMQALSALIQRCVTTRKLRDELDALRQHHEDIASKLKDAIALIDESSG